MPKRQNAQMPTSYYAYMPKFMLANGHFSIVSDSSRNLLGPNAQTSECPNVHKLEIFIILIWKKKKLKFSPRFFDKISGRARKSTEKKSNYFCLGRKFC